MAKTEKNPAKGTAVEKDVTAKMIKSDMYKLRLDQTAIQPGLNRREDYGDIQSLMESIVEVGIQMPLKGYMDGDKFIITEGHRRHEAVRLAHEAGHKNILIPLVQEAKGTTEADRILLQLISSDGKPLTMMEQASAAKALMDYGWDSATIAKKMGKSPAHVDNLMLLMETSPEVKEAIKEKKVSPSLVVDTVRQNIAKTGGKKTKAAVEEASAAITEAVEAAGDKPVKRSDVKEVTKKFNLNSLDKLINGLEATFGEEGSADPGDRPKMLERDLAIIERVKEYLNGERTLEDFYGAAKDETEAEAPAAPEAPAGE